MTGLRTRRRTRAGSPARLPAGRWTIDPEHSTVTFSIRHLTVATVHGAFERFDGWLETNGSGVIAAAGTVESDSVTTGDGKRDAALLKDGFLDVARYHTISLSAREIEQHDGDVSLVADLTLKGRTHPIRLTGTAGGIETDPGQPTRARIAAAGSISRSEFGVTGGGVLESAGALVSDTVKIEVDVTVIREPEDRR